MSNFNKEKEYFAKCCYITSLMDKHYDTEKYKVHTTSKGKIIIQLSKTIGIIIEHNTKWEEVYRLIDDLITLNYII